MMKFIIYGFFSIFLVFVAYIDKKTMNIPNKLNLLGFVVGIATIYFNPLLSWQQALLGAISGFSIMLLVSIITKGGFGAGDIKLGAVIGLFVGVFYTFYILFVAGWLQLIYQKFAKQKVAPFGQCH